jgi:hypothetical protein
MDRLNVLIRVAADIVFSRHVAAQDAVCVFDHASLPWAMRSAVPHVAVQLVLGNVVGCNSVPLSIVM